MGMNPGEGQGGSPRSPLIADIARHRRDRKGKSLPLINTDDADQNREKRKGYIA